MTKECVRSVAGLITDAEELFIDDVKGVNDGHRVDFVAAVVNRSAIDLITDAAESITDVERGYVEKLVHYMHFVLLCAFRCYVVVAIKYVDMCLDHYNSSGGL